LRAEAAGIDIIEVRINNLSYSVEIAQAMLQRQQASAIIAARRKIVEGAVGIVEEAADQLAEKHNFSEEKRAALVSDLLVVLVSESKVSPVLSVGKKSAL
jgi:3-dehydroquinate dehydratase